MIALKEVYDDVFFEELVNTCAKSYPNFNKKYFLESIFDKNWLNLGLSQI